MQADATLVDDHAVAAALGISVHSVRKDRLKDARIPFVRINGTVRYHLPRVFEALAEYEVGGPKARPGRRKPGVA